MAHIVTTKCVGCKFIDCVEVCPVACFYELDNQLLIHPDDCIDCTACVAECPVEAIYAEGDVPADFQANIEFNFRESRRLKDAGQAAILKKKDPLPTADARKAELGYYSPGTGPLYISGIRFNPLPGHASTITTPLSPVLARWAAPPLSISQNVVSVSSGLIAS